MRVSLLLAVIAASVSVAAAVPDSIALDNIVVTGTRSATDVRHLPMTVTTISREALVESHQSSLLPTVMQEVPGLFVSSRGMMGYGVSGGAAGGINLRGISGGAGQLLVLIDGHPQYNGIYGHPISDSYQTMIAERVEVLRGPASVLYGSNAMGGVLNIVTRRPQSDGATTTIDLGAGSWGTVQAQASNQLRLGRFSSTVAAEFGRTDNHRPRMGFKQYGGIVRLGYELSSHWRLNFNANITHFDASHPGTVDEPLYDADQWITRGEMSAAIENHYANTSGALSAYYNWGRHKIDDGTSDPTNPTQRYFRSKDALTGVSAYQSATLFAGNHITAGIDYQRIYGNAYYTSKADGSLLDTPNKQSGRSYRNEVGAYVDFRQDIVRWLTVDAAVRLDHHSVTGTEWVPQAGLVARPVDNGELKFMASKGFRNPTMREMYLYPPSNEELRPERLWNYELSWRHRPGSVTYGVNLYYIKGDNMIQTINRKNVNTGKVKNYGVELEAMWRVNARWQLSTNHSLLHMEHKIVGSPRYLGRVAARYASGRWHATLGVQHVNGLFTAVGDTPKTENFTLVNATVSFAAARCLTLWLRGDNLLAQRYEINAGYPMPRATFMAGATLRL
ncbi:MAG: TonB-dependent receptor [Muribaculaceae bacterium]|nr:TonB-dependent receptor [Muribaculaceae bacterium]